MELLKKQIFISNEFHKKVKHRAVDEQSTIEKVIAEILKKEFHVEED